MARRAKLYLFLLGVVMTICPPAFATGSDERARAGQRSAFVEAQAALASGKRPRYEALLKKVADYPLADYLVLADLSQRLPTAAETEIKTFLTRNASAPVGTRLRTQWLTYLAGQQRWKSFNEYYEPQEGDELRCHALRARLATGKIKPMMADVQRSWLVPHEQPAACNGVFDAWIKAGGLTEDLIWQRIRLAMEAGKISVAQTLAQKLNADGRAWVERWVQVHNSPARQLEQRELAQELPIAREIVRHGLMRLARLDANTANDVWRVHKARNTFTPEQVLSIEREIALQAAYARHPGALDWLVALPSDDDQVTQWRARAALLQSNWKALLGVIATVPAAKASQEHWVYWRARALAQLGIETAEPAYTGVSFDLFDTLAARRGYYGFLAADQLSRNYDFNERSLPFTEAELDEIWQRPGIQRAYELLFLGMPLDARKEWLVATAHMNSRQLQLSAVLAHQWGWHDRVILTLAQTTEGDDLGMRFPMVYPDQVLAAAARHQIDPAWVYGVIRQESAFMLDAKSRAGAMGLMQLMPATAALTARIIKTPYKGNHELLDLDRNINLGSAYLRKLSDQYAGHTVLATAAYNAGPRRVNAWLPPAELAADAWIEIIPFRETREYVKRVLTYTTIFDQRLDGQVTSMATRMPVVVNGSGTLLPPSPDKPEPAK